MALVLLKNHQHKFISAEQGNRIWRAMRGEINATPAQRQFIKLVDKLYLNKHAAPKSYLETQREQDREEQRQQRLPIWWPYKND